MRALVGLMLLLALAAAGPARAADERALQEARTRFQAGVQLFHEGSLDAALAEFRKAYQLAPTYRVLYNIAQVQAELRDYVEASKSFRQYLAEGGAEVPPDRRAQVEAELQKLERRVSMLEVTTNVKGASILIDDVPVGASPLGAPVYVNAGSRRITATKPGRVTTARSITVAGGDRIKVHIDLPEVAAAGPAPNPFDSAPAPAVEPPRTRMWVAMAVTAALGVGTGTFALLTQQKKKDFEAELDRFPNDRETIDRSRRRMALHAAVTDGLAAATLVSAGITIYFAVSGSSEPAREQARIRLLPSLGGLTVAGRF